MSTATMETIQSSIQEMTANLGRLRVRHSQLADSVDEIADAVRRGRAERAYDVADLIREQDALAQTIADQENELERATAELSRLKKDCDLAELRVLLQRMEQRREHIIQLIRQAAVEVGTLHTEDAQAAGKLVPLDRASIDRLRFIELLQPIDPYHDWADSMRDVPLDFLHVIKVRPVQKL